MAEIIAEDTAVNEVIAQGVEKLAQEGAAAAKPGMMDKVKSALKSGKDKAAELAAKAKNSKAGQHIGAHAGKYGLGAGLALGAGGAALAMKKKKKD